MPAIRFFAFAILSILLYACGSQDTAKGGTAVETTNGISATLYLSHGAPAAFAAVHIRTETYLPYPSNDASNTNQSFDVQCDSNGFFSIDSLPIGNYILWATLDSEAIMMSLSKSKSPILLADSLQLKPTVRASGVILLPPSQTTALVVIPGTTISTWTNSQGEFEFQGLPQGTFEVVAILPGTDVVMARETITIQDESPIVLDTIESLSESSWRWSDSLLITIDTRDLLLKNSVVKFPLHIQFQGDQFPMEISAQGADLRFRNMQGQSIPFEIENYNADKKILDLWLLVDSIPAHDSIALGWILWGQPAALSQSNSSLVFPESNAWSAVWHLSSSFTNDGQNRLTPDASSHQNQGTLFGNLITTETGTWFGTDNSTIRFTHVPIDFGQDSVTLETWFNPSDVGVYLLHVDPHSNNWNHLEKAFRLGEVGTSLNDTGRLSPQMVTWGNDYATTLDSISLNEWVHLTLTLTPHDTTTGDWFASTIRWYVNGVYWPVNDSTIRMEADAPTDTLLIGSLFGQGMRGWMGEMSIAKTVRSEDWIQLSAALWQKPDSILFFSRP